jgi:hypothetical protein
MMFDTLNSFTVQLQDIESVAGETAATRTCNRFVIPQPASAIKKPSHIFPQCLDFARWAIESMGRFKQRRLCHPNLDILIQVEEFVQLFP